MSFLLKLFRNRTRQMNITICGLDGAGKTTIVKYLDSGRFVDTSPTLGINHETLQLPKLQLNIFDLGGQTDFRGMWHEVNEKSDGVVFVVDRSNLMRLEEAKGVFKNIVETQVHEDVTILILLHKSDLEEGITRADFIHEFELTTLGYNWACFETSAINGANIYDSFKWFIDQLKETLEIG
ncbi:MAG: GTP-binding protein [Asgard group archaeon]|nr:GTP-binding protein [Asgard group archaeon]